MEYPVAAIQHTRAVIALTLITICLETYVGSNLGLADELRKRINSCATLVKKKKLSAGAKKDMDNCQIVVSEHIEAMQPSRNEAYLYKWSVLLWTALTFVEDVLATCPQYTVGLEKGKWKKLCTTISTLATSLQIQYPGIDEEGTYLYERAAWALEGVCFRRPE